MSAVRSNLSALARGGLLLLAGMVCCGTLLARPPQQGPITPPPGREVKRIPVTPAAEPPPIPVEEIIRRFTQHENEIIRLRNAATYQVNVRLQEFDAEGNPSGEFQMTSENLFAPDGKPYERVIKTTRSTLMHITAPSEDLADYGRIQPFSLSTTQLPGYELTYQGKQPLDELTTYIFRVQPRRLERGRRLFDGVIYVDDRDFAIVKSYGKMISEVEQDPEREPFLLYETYRQQVDGKYWFPAYIRSERTYTSKSGDWRLRLTVRYANYKIPAAPAAAPPPK